MDDKTRRFYEVGEFVWVIDKRMHGEVKEIDSSNLEVTVETDNEELVLKLWEIDKLKYKARENMEKYIGNRQDNKSTYFASVNNGVIPTKSDENAGRDCYARLEPEIRDGVEVYEMFIERFTLAKIPLGFASYLDKSDFLSLKHERSSVGSAGLINVSGLIDSTYQGEVILQVIPLVSDVVISSEVKDKYYDEKTNTHFIPYDKGICQAVIMTQSLADDVHIEYCELLNKPSTRGTGGWGSSGK